ncbi:hypothetical protein J2W91_002411 [Paenibacillus amylolyticus]|uniref:Uncharacterized protein n=1 Tax=Paenibacillus amylolyticus TaxID=1451 RepID=A0AAP5LQZ3_PAEAM|nr:MULTISPECIES: hypothetical protein [Paenibacillus]MDR6723949.1 hypothetical protein [Paenibacillus amylolyticus]
MNSVFEVCYSWNKEAIPTGGADPVYMMIEWRNGSPAKRLRKLAPKIVSRDLELLLKPEYGIELKGIYGCRSKETDIGWVLRLGDVYKGESKQILLEFAMGSRLSGKASVCSAYWSTRKLKQSQRVLLRREQLYIQYTSHLGMLRQPEDPKVEKTIKLSETVPLIKQALRAYERGRVQEGSNLLRRHADALLIEAARKQDLDYYEEAEMVEKLRYHYGITYANPYQVRGKTMLGE